MWKYIVEPGSLIWRTLIACSIPNATDTLSEYVIPTAYPQQQWLGEGALVLRLYMHGLFCS
jgi:hypothetical protein